MYRLITDAHYPVGAVVAVQACIAARGVVLPSVVVIIVDNVCCKLDCSVLPWAKFDFGWLISAASADTTLGQRLITDVDVCRRSTVR